jgi:hypothetical protein
MALEQEASRRQWLHVLGTALDFIDLSAGTALEMMMMGLRGSLIVWRLPGQLHLHEPPFFHESFDGTIDRCDPQTWRIYLRDLEYLLWTQRTAGFFDDAPDSPALACITFHSKIVHRIGELLQYQCRGDMF